GLAVSSAQARRVGRADAAQPSVPIGTWSPAASMSIPRAQFYVSPQLPNGKVLVAGGVSAGHVVASAELYDPATDTWSPAAPMQTPRSDLYQPATLLGNGKVLIVGGVDNVGVLASTELYNPATNTWSSAGNLRVARFDR